MFFNKCDNQINDNSKISYNNDIHIKNDNMKGLCIRSNNGFMNSFSKWSIVKVRIIALICIGIFVVVNINNVSSAGATINSNSTSKNISTKSQSDIGVKKALDKIKKLTNDSSAKITNIRPNVKKDGQEYYVFSVVSHEMEDRYCVNIKNGTIYALNEDGSISSYESNKMDTSFSYNIVIIKNGVLKTDDIGDIDDNSLYLQDSKGNLELLVKSYYINFNNYIADIQNAEISVDNKNVYFLVPSESATGPSYILYSVGIKSKKTQRCSYVDKYQLIKSGTYKGKLTIWSNDIHNDKNGESLGREEFTVIIDSSGKELTGRKWLGSI